MKPGKKSQKCPFPASLFPTWTLLLESSYAKSTGISVEKNRGGKGPNPNCHQSRRVCMTAGYESFRATWKKFYFRLGWKNAFALKASNQSKHKAEGFISFRPPRAARNTLSTKCYKRRRHRKSIMKKKIKEVIWKIYWEICCTPENIQHEIKSHGNNRKRIHTNSLYAKVNSLDCGKICKCFSISTKYNLLNSTFTHWL